MTLLKKYGIKGLVYKFKELNRMIPATQLFYFSISESKRYMRAIVKKYLSRWGYFGSGVHFGKSIFIPFPYTKYLNNHVDLNDFCRIEGKGVVKIGFNTGIGDFTIIRSSNYVEIGNNVLVGPRVFISDSDHEFYLSNRPIYLQPIKSKKVIIGDDVFIGTNSIILKGVTIGNGAVIGAGSLVLKDIPAYKVAVGNPARVIKDRDSNLENLMRYKSN